MKPLRSSKDTVENEMTSHTPGEKAYINKGLESKYRRTAQNSMMRKQIIQFKKWAKDLNKCFSKEDNTDGK